MSDPKNCPWCGRPTVVIRSALGGKFWSACDESRLGCGATGPKRSDREAAIAAWDAIVLVQPNTLGDALDGPWPIRYVSREEIERLYPQPQANLQTMTDEESQIP